ncbi:hypothetical protein JD276_11130 [Leucobacter sp. CSA1]|uniref:Uncharacterized protein n=1 Tax=Leucobacter chromiisoli TaxID=2796471 RepID=A0A934Q8C7_9MICO|nr:hypothetical protein [Leucobacter chromiisoli]MBK0419588.1 hypothetical protein [Leucobacter chromiisoli]
MIGQLWSALAAIGSGLILMAVAAGADPRVAIPLIIAAAAELAWGVLTMRAGRVIAPRTALIACGIVLAAATALLFTRTIGLVPFVALLTLHWITAVFAALRLRRGSRRSSPAPRSGAFVLTLTVQAMLVAAITTPALAQTEPGASAVPHGTLHDGHH